MFLERSGARAVNGMSLNPPNPNCPICSLFQVRVEIDPEVATVNDLVEGVLRMELGYGKDISIAIPGQIIYEPVDPDYPDNNLEDNLEKKLSNWSIGQNSFLKVSDENYDDEKDTRVDIEIIIIEK